MVTYRRLEEKYVNVFLNYYNLNLKHLIVCILQIKYLINNILDNMFLLV